MISISKHLGYIFFIVFLVSTVLSGAGCTEKIPNSTTSTPQQVPHDSRWGIYSLDPASGEVALIYSSTQKITNLDLDTTGNRLVFSRQVNGTDNKNEEIYTFSTDTGVLNRLTDNEFMDVYPVWSPDGSQIAFLSWRDQNLDIYLMEADGRGQRLLFDSGYHDADIDWTGEKIAFTSQSMIWTMNENGTEPRPVTDPPRAGVWGNANLPFGDYDPRFSPDGKKIAFERMVDDTSPHGNYDIFVIESDGSNEKRLTDSGYSQGMISWSHAGDKAVYGVAAIDDKGKYDIYTMNPDGSDITNITPSYFPPDFLCHTPIYSADDESVYFIGQWWE